MYKLNLVFLLIAGLLFGCSENVSQQTQSDNKILTKAEIHEIGVKHNEALAQVFVGFQEHKDHLKDRSKVKYVVSSELSSFFRENFNSINYKSASEYSSKETSKYFNKSEKFTISSDKNITPIEVTIRDNKEHLSETQISLLKEINNVLKMAASDLETILEELDAIEEKTEELSPEDAQVILVGIEVGKASVKYWNENFDDWQKALANSQTKEQTKAISWFSLTEVTGADVGGAVGGAVGAAVVNAIPGAGQIGYAGAIAGGAAAGSAASAVEQVWNHVF